MKLIEHEPESPALHSFLRPHRKRTSCALVRVELAQAARQHGPAASRRARQVIEDLDLIPLDDPLLDVAAELDLPGVRSLDAIHLAAAQLLGRSLDALVTYDARMASAAQRLRIPVASPR